MNTRGGALRLSIQTVFTSVLLLLSVCPCHKTGGTNDKSFSANHFEKIVQKVPYYKSVDEGRDARQVPEAPEAHLSRAGMKL